VLGSSGEQKAAINPSATLSGRRTVEEARPGGDPAQWKGTMERHNGKNGIGHLLLLRNIQGAMGMSWRWLGQWAMEANVPMPQHDAVGARTADLCSREMPPTPMIGVSGLKA